MPFVELLRSLCNLESELETSNDTVGTLLDQIAYSKHSTESDQILPAEPYAEMCFGEEIGFFDTR